MSSKQETCQNSTDWTKSYRCKPSITFVSSGTTHVWSYPSRWTSSAAGVDVVHDFKPFTEHIKWTAWLWYPIPSHVSIHAKIAYEWLPRRDARPNSNSGSANYQFVLVLGRFEPSTQRFVHALHSERPDYFCSMLGILVRGFHRQVVVGQGLLREHHHQSIWHKMVHVALKVVVVDLACSTLLLLRCFSSLHLLLRHCWLRLQDLHGHVMLPKDHQRILLWELRTKCSLDLWIFPWWYSHLLEWGLVGNVQAWLRGLL